MKKDDASGSFDSLTGSTISSRAYANALETAYAGYLWAKGELDTSEEAIADAPTGASTVTEGADTPTGATVAEGDYANETEPEAQKGEVTNE